MTPKEQRAPSVIPSPGRRPKRACNMGANEPTVVARWSDSEGTGGRSKRGLGSTAVTKALAPGNMSAQIAWPSRR